MAIKVSKSLVYTTRDGQTFTDCDLANKHELKLNVRQLVDKFSHCPDEY